MKAKLLLVTLIIAISGLSPDIAKGQELQIKNVNGANIQFDGRTEYLRLEISQLAAIEPAKTKWWERLLGKSANFVLCYVEVTQGSKSSKLPVFTYKKVTDESYDYKSLGIFKSLIGYPLLEWAAFNEKAPIQFKVVVKSWEEKDDAAAIEKILDGASVVGAIDPTGVTQALAVATQIVDLVNVVWPEKNKANELTISLAKTNLKKEFIEIGYKGSEASSNPIITFKLSKNPARFVGTTFSDAYGTISNQELEIWRKAILSADLNIASAGLSSVLAQLGLFAEYVNTLELVYVDKVLFVAGAINVWCGNSYRGTTNDKGDLIKMNVAQYRKLAGAEWTIANQYSTYLDDMEGNNKCTTDACRSMATFLAKLSIGDKDGAGSYLGQTINMEINGKINIVPRASFITNMNLYFDSPFETKYVDELNYTFTFHKGNIKFKYGDIEFIDNKVEVRIVKVDSAYYIKSISIVS